MMFRKVGAKKPEAPPAPPPPAAATSDDDDDDDSLASDADSDVAPSSAPPAALAAFQKRGGWSKPAAPAPVPAPAPAAARDSEEDEEDEDEESGSASESAFPMHKAAPASSSAPSSQPEAEPGSISRTSSGIGRSGEAVSLEEKIAQEWAFQAAMSGSADAEQHLHDPPPPAGHYLDRWGFICEGQSAPPLSKEEAALEASRLKKWIDMGISSADKSGWRQYLANHREHVKERCRKGIPNELRGVAWQSLTGARELRLRNLGLYESLLQETSPCEVDIIRDVSRTFPTHIHYSQRHGLGQRQLFRVLKAFSVYDTETGYVQGMAYIAAIMLLYASEEEAFWLLVAIMKGAGGAEPLEGLFAAGLPLVQQCLFQLEGMIKHVSPKLAAHLAAENADPTMYATQWFITLFSYSLPFDVVLRIWDVFMMEGLKIVFRVAMTLLLSQQESLFKLHFEELVPALRRAPNAGKASADALISSACDLKVSKRLDELEREYAKQASKT